MEYLVGFEFDLQRQAALNLSQNITSLTNVEAGKTTIYVTSADNLATFDYTTTEPAEDTNLVMTLTVSSTTANTFTAANVKGVVFKQQNESGVLFSEDATITSVTGMDATTPITIGDATIKTAAEFSSTAGVIATTATTGSINVSVVAQKTATVNGVTFGVDTSGAAVTADVTKAGVVTNLSAGGAAAVALDNGQSISTVTTNNGAGAYTINGVEYTITAAASPSSNAVTFTPATDAEHGATAVSGLDAGATLAFTADANNKAITVNTNGKFDLTAADNAKIYAATNDAYLLSGKANISSDDDDHKSVKVSTEEGVASTVEAVAKDGSTASAFIVGPKGTYYEITGIGDGEKITIDGTTYTYTQNDLTLLDENNKGYILASDGTVSFNIIAETKNDTIYGDTAFIYTGPIAGTGTKVKDVVDNITDANAKFFYKADGTQQGIATADNDTAYTFEKKTDGESSDVTFELKSTANATGENNLAIDLTGVTATVDLSLGTSTEALTVGAGTSITEGTLGAGDKIGGTTVKTGGTGTFSATGAVVTLTDGTYTAIDNGTKIDAASDKTVTLDSVLSVASGKATYTAATASAGTVLASVVGIDEENPAVIERLTATDDNEVTDDLTITGTSGDTVLATAVNSKVSVDNSGEITLTDGSFTLGGTGIVSVKKGTSASVVATATGKGVITVTAGSVDVTADGVVSNISEDAVFTIVDVGGDNLTTFTAGEGSLTVNGVKYTGTLADATVTMAEAGVETPTGLTAPTGIDFTDTTGTQYFDLGTTLTAAQDASTLNRITETGFFVVGNYYLVYDGTTKTLNIQQADSVSAMKTNADDSYTGAITVDATALAAAATEGKANVDLTLGNDGTTKHDDIAVILTNANSAYLTVKGVTADDTINGVSMAGADTSDLTVVSSDSKSNLTSISGLANGTALGGTDKLPAGIEITTKTETGTFTVNEQAFTLTSTANTIKTATNSAYLYAGEATLSSTGAAEGTLNVGKDSAATLELSSSDNSSASATVTVTAGVPAISALTNKAVLKAPLAGIVVETASSAGTYTVNEVEYKGTAQLTIHTSADSSVLNAGTVTLEGDGATLKIGAYDDNASALVTNKTIELSELDASDANNPGATIVAASGTLATSATAVTLSAVGTGITGVAGGDTDNVTITTAGLYSINGIQFTTADASETAHVDTDADATTLTISAGIQTGTADKTYVIGSQEYTSVSANVDLTAAHALLNKEGEYVAVKDKDKLTVLSLGETTANGQIQITSGGVVSKVDSSGSAVANGFEAGDSFTLGGATYTFKTSGDKTTLTIKNGGDNSGIYDVTGIQITSVTDVAGDNKDTVANLPAVKLSQPLALSTKTFEGNEDKTTLTFDANGQDPEVTSDAAIATVTRSSTSVTDNYTLKVTGKPEADVEITDVTAAITDAGTGTGYVIDDVGTTFQVNGTATVNASDVITAATGTISVTSGSMKTQATGAAYDVTADENSVLTFVAGTALSSTKVTTNVGMVTITETNKDSDTTVAYNGTIAGIDGEATITGAAAGQSITTVNDGKTTINGRAYTVSDDGNGVTYTAAGTGVSVVAGLKTGATLTLGGSFTGYSITVTGTDTAEQTFSGIHSEDGIGITVTSTGYDVTLDKANEAVTIGTKTYKVNSTSDGITVDSKTGKVSGLTNGDKVSIIDSAAGTVTYEITDGLMVITNVSGSTTTYKLADASTPFTATYTSSGTTGTDGTFAVTGQSTDREETATTDGLKIGSNAGEVNTVTNGMLVDKNGNATTDTSKATAKLTITDSGDAIKYEAQTNNAQTITVAADTGAANMEWDVNTGNGADTINIASSKDSIINAGDGKNSVTVGGSGNATVKTGSGNDTILINGTGEALVEVAGGNNKITHTGTGESTLKGGSGNDTFESNNENDTIVFGDGSNTLKMTANVTNTISDYEYGKDKLNTAAYTGTLALDDINVGTDGTIGYGTTEGTAKIGNDGQSVYAATLADADGRNKRNVGWTGAEGGMLNATGQTERVVLIGNSEGAHDTLMGGQAGDTLKAGTGASSLWGGAGNDVIISSSTDSNEIFFLAGDGKDTVQGFTAYTEATAETADVLDFYGQGATDIKMTADGLKIYNGESSMLLSGSYDADTMFRWKGNTGDEVRVAKIGYQDSANTMTYEDAATDYIGGKGIDTINATGGEVNLWMDGSQGKTFGNIEVINAAGNAENVTIAGGEGKNTLVGGNGDSSLWGGTGSADDVLVGNGQTDFFYNMGGGNDSIAGHTGDTVDLFDMQLSDFTGIELDTANRRVILSTTAGHNVTISGGVDTFKVGGQTWTTSYASGSDWTLKE